MKKLLLVLTITAALIVVILSCKKQHDDSSQVNPTVQVKQTNQNIEARILSFKSDIESGLKTGSGYAIGTAVWNIEALVNYTYADVANNLQGLSLDSVFLDVDLTDGKVSTGEAASVYAAIIDSLTIQYENLPSQNLHLIFADVFSKDSIAGSVKFGVISAFGHGSVISSGTFGSDDWWIFGWAQYNNGGYCGESPYHDTHLDEDAATRIEQRIRLHIGMPEQRNYATDLVTLEVWPDGVVNDLGDEEDEYACDFRVPNDPLDNYNDFYIMYKYSEITPFDPCLCPNEMNFYYNGTRDVCYTMLYDCLEELLDDKVFMSIKMVGDNEDSEEYHYYHKLTNTYGIWVLNNDPPGTW